VAAAVEAALSARAVVAARLRPTSPGRRRIMAAVDAFVRAVAGARVGDDRPPTAAERAAAAEGLRAARRVVTELRRTMRDLRAAARRRERSIIERAVDAPADAAAAVAAEVADTLAAAADRIERAATNVAASATEAWGRAVVPIGLGGVVLLGVGAWFLLRKG
jgi:hypothetical protein